MFWLKVLISAAAIALASEVAKRVSPFWGAFIIALPLASMLVLAFTWWDTRNDELATQLAKDIFILIPVSLTFFLPFLLNRFTSLSFIPNFAAGLLLMLVCVFLVRKLIPGLI